MVHRMFPLFGWLAGLTVIHFLSMIQTVRTVTTVLERYFSCIVCVSKNIVCSFLCVDCV